DYLAKIRFNLGACLYRSNKAKEAVPEFSSAIRLRKGNYQRAYYALGMAESEQKNWANARRAFLDAIKLNKADGEAWFDLAFVYLAEKDFEHAEQAFQKSIVYNSVDSALGHNNVGVILAMKGDFAAAVKEFENALNFSQGRLIEARNNIEFCKALSSNRPELVAKMKFSNKKVRPI
ncbi:MAG: tetratricopeptide repeat protein, partial [Pyrinomonadaceae bacterium]